MAFKAALIAHNVWLVERDRHVRRYLCIVRDQPADTGTAL
jgi:hypothetical protein